MTRALWLVVATAVLLLALSGVALAASPQDIYDDFAANGKLTGNYTNTELQAFLDNALTSVYGDPQRIADLKVLIAKMLNQKPDSGGRPEFPFTGAQLLLIAVSAAALVGGGLGLRRFSRSRG